jgi:hypothetical protein
MFEWKDGADEAAIRLALAELDRLPQRIDEVRRFHVGTDAGLAEGNFDCVVVADFDDMEAYQRYAAHAAHTDLIRDHLKPLIATRAAVQHELA